MVGKIGYEIFVPGDDPSRDQRGDHGYDNEAESMHPIFYAFGPAFRQNLLADSFRNVDLYPLMSHVLGLEQRPTNGSFDNVKHVLVGFSQKDFLSHSVRLVGDSIKTLFASNLLGKVQINHSLKWNDLCLVALCLILAIVLALIYAVVALCFSRPFLISHVTDIPVHYRLLSNQDDAMNQLVDSDSDNAEEHP